jgi:magnesium-transporting ATPase (P-type)
LPTVTLSLAMGAWRMAKRGALVRRLEAVETLGSTTFICSDKTGTLTTNQMSAVELWTPAGVGRVRGRGYEPSAELEMSPTVLRSAERLALAAARSSSGRALKRDGSWIARGDPMEAALHALSMRLGIDVRADEREHPEVARFPFDPHRRRMSVAVKGTAYAKGAPDSLLPLCEEGEGAQRAAAEMTARGLRVIAVATRRLTFEPKNSADLESNLELLGLVGLLDPPRPEVKAALEACHRAGIRVAMVTGDHPGTARAIAREVGLGTDLVVSGSDLPDDDALLGALLDRDGVIACRVSPEQKLRIAKALQARGHVVAMTGDGVNDGPALQQADIGIAMGLSGTDVARDAADMVLLDDRFESIVHAIEQGRATFANIRRFLTYHLTDNVAELAPFVLWALSGGRFPLALGVLQILCLDLLTDQLPALALGAEPPSRHALSEPPHRRRLVDAQLLVRAFGVLGPVEALVAIAVFTTVLVSSGWRPGAGMPTPSALAVASGAAFVAIVIGQVAAALACRSWSRPGWRVPPRTNPLLFIALIASLTIVILLVYVPALARLLGHAPPNAVGLTLAALAFPAVLLADAAHKLWTGRTARRVTP